jgi:hypothetical protein
MMTSKRGRWRDSPSRDWTVTDITNGSVQLLVLLVRAVKKASRTVVLADKA